MSKSKLSYWKRSSSFFGTQFSGTGGGGGGGFLQISSDRMIEWGQKSTPPPQKKKRHPRTSSVSSITSDCFENAKNPHVNEIRTKKIPESKISTPQKSFNQPRHLKSGAPPPPLPIAFKTFKRYRQRKTQSNPIKQNL